MLTTMSLEWHLRQTVEKFITIPLEAAFYILAGFESILAEVLLSAGRPTPSQCAVRLFPGVRARCLLHMCAACCMRAWFVHPHVQHMCTQHVQQRVQRYVCRHWS